MKRPGNNILRYTLGMMQGTRYKRMIAPDEFLNPGRNHIVQKQEQILPGFGKK